jgi:hypothetical protein
MSKAISSLAVKLPDLSSIPKGWRGKKYEISRLLTQDKGNTKLRKSIGKLFDGKGWRIWGLALANANTSGHQVCGSASTGCIGCCLEHQGMAFFESVRAARAAKTIAFFEHRDWFEAALRQELGDIVLFGRATALGVAYRPNLFSDLMWEKIFPWMFEPPFDEIQVFDYTKHAKRMLRFLDGGLPPSYHLTFSRSENNEDKCQSVLQHAGNVAIAFRNWPFPATWWGHKVINGDAHDLRFLDPQGGYIVGLKAKGTARKDTSGFVVDASVPARLALSMA